MSETTLLKVINSHCVCVSHEHRYAYFEEYSFTERTNFTNNGCYLCNNQLNNFESRKWYCPEFTSYNKHSLPIEKKIIALTIFSDGTTPFYLPNELIMLIFDMCVYTTKCNQIKKITLNLVNHAKTCRPCAKTLIAINSTLSCPTHLIPRKQRLENYFQSYHA